MIEWKTPEITDRHWVRQLLPCRGRAGNDLAFASMYLWRHRYALMIAAHDGCLLRRYDGPYGRIGYAFPLSNDPTAAAIALGALEMEANGDFAFCLLSEEQKTLLEKFRPGQFDFTTSPADSDYLYNRTDLAELPGRRYMRKRNAIAHFNRRHSDAEIRPLTVANTADALTVATGWMDSRLEAQATTLEEETLLRGEFQATAEALTNLTALEMFGAVLYCDRKPVAMTVASAVNADVCDVHFEKALPEYARDQAYAVINRGLAVAQSNFLWFNREEDVGDENLRRAKESYRPETLYVRYRATRR